MASELRGVLNGSFVGQTDHSMTVTTGKTTLQSLPNKIWIIVPSLPYTQINIQNNLSLAN